MLDTTGGTTPQTNDLPFTLLRRAHFPGLKFPRAVLQHGGRLLKTRGEAETLAYLEGKGEIEPYDVRPPAKCLIVAQSRPFAEWPIAIVSRELQTALYKVRLSDYEGLASKFTKTEDGRQLVLSRLGVGHRGVHVQALNLIIPHALNIYGGVLVKVANRNEKKALKHQKANERRREQGFDVDGTPTPESAIGEDGYLLAPPGVNPTIQVYQGASPRAVVHTRGLPGVPERFGSYTRDPVAPLRVTGTRDRCSIPPGEPGHIPAFQYAFLSRKKGRRVRAWFAEASNRPKKGRRPESVERALAREKARDEGVLLVSIKIREDWILLDARGLLRNVVHRGLATDALSLQGLLDMFSGDPVIDPARGLVTFIYKAGVVPLIKRKTTNTKKAPELLGKLVEARGTIGMVSVDLGQTNPIAARVSRIGPGLEPEFVSQLALPDDLKAAWASYRSASDQLEARLKGEAIALLSDEHRADVTRVNAYCPAEGKRLLAERFGVDFTNLPWDLMSSGTSHIADRFLRDRPADADLVHFNNQKKGRLKRTDLNIYRWTRPRLIKETRDELNRTLWDLKTKSTDYSKLSLRKRELSRRCANWLVRETRRISRCDTVVVNCEDLNVRFFHGSGKRDIGWDQFFVPKRENRWLIQALHKAMTELAPHQGIPVIEVNPARTSITCPRCGVCDRKNRDGESFCCVACGHEGHADFEVACRNIEHVALTGQAMPKPKDERPSPTKKAGGARKPKPAREAKDKSLTGGQGRRKT